MILAKKQLFSYKKGFYMIVKAFDSIRQIKLKTLLIPLNFRVQG